MRSTILTGAGVLVNDVVLLCGRLVVNLFVLYQQLRCFLGLVIYDKLDGGVWSSRCYVLLNDVVDSSFFFFVL